MPTPNDAFLEAHPHAGPAWYLALAHLGGRLLALPGLQRWEPVARRVQALTQGAGRVTVFGGPGAIRPADARGITVLSANLWHDWPRHQRWPERLEAVAQLVEAVNVDILLLQEVARTRTLKADLWLAERLGLGMTFARANGDVGAIGFEEGPAVLSRFPLGDVHLRELSSGHNPMARRVALASRLETPHGPVLAVSVHLGLFRRQNGSQIRRLRAWVRERSSGDLAIIGGDFNAPEARAEITQTRREWTDTFRALDSEGDAMTHTRRWSRPGALRHRRLDYVFVQQPAIPWRVLKCRHLDAPGEPHSDHHAVLTRLAPGG